jgi:hypothetical protein
MPTLYTSNAEGGTHGTTVTAGNSGGASGTAFTAVAKGASSTVQFSNAQPAHGSLGYFLSHVSGEASYFTWVPSGDATSSYAAREYIYFTGNPPGDEFIMQFRNGSTSVMTLSITSAGKLKCLNTAASAVYTSTASLSTGTLYRVEARIIKGTTTGDGTINVAFYPGDSTTPVETPFSSAAMNVGTTDIASVRFGRSSSIAQAWSCYLDDIALQTGATGLIGPTANAAPTATITSNQTVAASASVSATVIAADSDGTIASYAWTGTRYTTTGAPASITLTNPTTATCSYTASALTSGVLDVLSCLITDNGGATVTKTTEVRVPTTGAAKPLSGYDSATASWTLIGGGASVGASLNDGSSTTRVESPDITGTASEQLVRLAPMATRTSYRQTITDAVLTTTVTNTDKVRFYTGVTQVTERLTSTLKKTTDNTTSDVTTSDLSLYFDLTGPEVTAMSDWGYPVVGIVTVV